MGENQIAKHMWSVNRKTASPRVGQYMVAAQRPVGSLLTIARSAAQKVQVAVIKQL